MRFAALDAWRGVAALFVALYHFTGFGYLFSLPLLRGSFLFVDFFFVLSGFVIAHAYGDRVASRDQAANFIVRRFGRLWPLHAFLLAVFVGLEGVRWAVIAATGMTPALPPFHSGGDRSVWAIVTHVLMLHAMDVHDLPTWNQPSWSIGAEFWTYVVFAGLGLPLAGRGLLWRAAAYAGMAALGLAAVIALSRTGIDTSSDFGFVRCLFGFFAGALAHLIWRHTQLAALPLHGVLTRHATAIEAAAVALAVIYLSWFHARLPGHAAPLVFVAVVLVFAGERGRISRSLAASRLWQSLGAWSYSIYMVHALIVMLLSDAMKVLERLAGWSIWTEMQVEDRVLRMMVGEPRLLFDALAVVYLLVVVGVAQATYRFIEVPARERINAWCDARFTRPGRRVDQVRRTA